MTRRGSGVTYVELLLVVAMMSILTAVVLPTGITLHRRTKEVALWRSLNRIRAAIDAYHRDWERGCIESKNEDGWPRDLEELRDGLEWGDSPICNPDRPVGAPTSSRDREREPETKVYLARVPEDPFNVDGDPWDTLGWKARAYDDEPDAQSWKGDGLYDVYSSSELTALDGTKYSEW